MRCSADGRFLPGPKLAGDHLQPQLPATASSHTVIGGLISPPLSWSARYGAWHLLRAKDQRRDGTRA